MAAELHEGGAFKKPSVTGRSVGVHAVSQRETADGGFAAEENLVWESVLNKLIDTCTNGSTHNRLCPITRSDGTALQIVRTWLANKLPHSCRILMEVDLFTQCQNSTLWVDNCADPTVVCYTRCSPDRLLEASVYTPYTHNEIALDRVMNTIEAVQRCTGLTNLECMGIDKTLYEFGILANISNLWTAQFVDVGGLYVYDGVLANHRTNPMLPAGFEHGDLRVEDAEIINDTWKYKSSTSIALVQRMIGMGLCCGIRSTSDGQLVSWFLTYPDGSIGMLHTLPEYRGKGLARAVVLAVLSKHAALHAQEPRPCSPYLYIECKNVASQALFTSLGFLKCNDVVWAGLALQL